MDWLDYRQALGLSFNDDQKKNLFIKRIEVFMRSGKRYSFTERDEIAFAYMTGETYLPSDLLVKSKICSFSTFYTIPAKILL